MTFTEFQRAAIEAITPVWPAPAHVVCEERPFNASDSWWVHVYTQWPWDGKSPRYTMAMDPDDVQDRIMAGPNGLEDLKRQLRMQAERQLAKHLGWPR